MRQPGSIDNNEAAEVVRRLFDLKANDRPAFVDGVVSPVAESRAIRPWEEFFEGILRWQARITGLGVAGQFTGASIQGIAGAAGPFLEDVIVIRSVQNDSGNPMRVFVGAGGLGGAATQFFAAPMDRRWRFPFATVSPIAAFYKVGAGGVYTGTLNIGFVPANSVRDFWYVNTDPTAQLTAETTVFEVVSAAFNVAIDTTITGYIIRTGRKNA